MIKDLSQSLVAAVAEINKSSRQKYVTELNALNEKVAGKAMKMPKQPEPKADPAAHSGAADMAKKHDARQEDRWNYMLKKKGIKKEEAVVEGSEGSHPRNEKEKKLAAMTPPANKITHGDVLKGRGVMRKEGWDDMLKAAKERRAAEGTGKFDKKATGTGTVYTRKSSTFDDGGKDADMKKAEKKMKQEERDTPGNSTHQCAIHVKSEQFGEGRTLTSQHAEPDADGHIAWYDVMFAEGIKRVNTEDIEVLVSESHMNHKKKKGM